MRKWFVLLLSVTVLLLIILSAYYFIDYQKKLPAPKTSVVDTITGSFKSDRAQEKVFLEDGVRMIPAPQDDFKLIEVSGEIQDVNTKKGDRTVLKLKAGEEVLTIDLGPKNLGIGILYAEDSYLPIQRTWSIVSVGEITKSLSVGQKIIMTLKGVYPERVYFGGNCVDNCLRAVAENHKYEENNLILLKSVQDNLKPLADIEYGAVSSIILLLDKGS